MNIALACYTAWVVQLCMGKNNILQLPFNTVTEEFKVFHIREAMQYRDPKVSAAGTEIWTGREWSAIRELEMAESRLKHKAVVEKIIYRKIII